MAVPAGVTADLVVIQAALLLHISQSRLTRLRPAETAHEPLMHRIQFTRPQPEIRKIPTHNHTNDRPGYLS